MESAIGAASWLVGKLLNKLSDDFVEAYVASSELGLNSEQINTKLRYMQGLLHAAQERDVSHNPGLQNLLESLSKKADEAEDALDELHYFMIQDKLDSTQEAAAELGDGLRGHARHGRHAARHTLGNWIPCFSCSHTQDDDSVAAAVITNTVKHGSDSGKVTFDRVAMSNKIKFVIESIHNLCDPISKLLSKIPNNSDVVTIKRPPTGSTAAQHKLYGRSVIFEQTINALINDTYHTETLSVLPFVGPGGIGKATFTQHLYNDQRIETQFTVRVWVCVSTDFDVIKLTRQILSCISATEKEGNNTVIETSNLDQLQKTIIQKLKSKSFLIVLDDIWKCNSECDWKTLLAPLRNGDTKGNMVLVTTRFPAIAHMVSTTTDHVELHGLEPDEFFVLFEACIFGHAKPEHYDDELTDVARDIAKKLKGSPLAANTVGRLLKKNLSREYWMEVLEKKEWQKTINEDDIMPSLKISYHYLPYYLKKCFSYCALFPEDYRFYSLDITRIWIAIGIVDPSCQDNSNYLEELVDNGFLMEEKLVDNDFFMEENDNHGQCYVMHDLMHELSRNVSSQDCANISSLCFTADSIPHSIRHISVTIQDIYDENFREEMAKLKSMLDIKNLRTLLIFGYHDARIANVLTNTFEHIKSLRVLSIAMNTQGSLPNNFSNLIHLQYLQISSPYGLEITLPRTLSRFYHLKFLNLEYWRGSTNLPKDFSRLVNLAHINHSEELLSNIPEIGRMKCLQDLKSFYVKEESLGFGLKELGELRELGGELTIYNLQMVASKEEASGAKLMNKRNMKELRLFWARTDQTMGDVLDGLEPHPNLRVLHIINSGVAAGPSWLCGDISTKRLESLYLEGLSWDTLPAFEQLPYLTKLSLRNVGMCEFGPGFDGITERSFMHLKNIWFEDMPELVKWVGPPNSHWFPRIESIKFKNCPLLSSFPFLECSDRFTKLSTLVIDYCPQLSQFPPLPHTSTLTYVTVRNNGSTLSYNGNQLSYEYSRNQLSIDGYNGALVFHNMDKLQFVEVRDVSHVSLSEISQLEFLRTVCVHRCDSMFTAELLDGVILHSVQNLVLEGLCIQGELFSKLLKCFPTLSNITIENCNDLDLLPVEDGGLFDLMMLQSFTVLNCENMFSGWPIGEVGGVHTIKPFPPSLTTLEIREGTSLKSMALLSNLTRLTNLRLFYCENLTMDGFNLLMTDNLKELAIYNHSNEFTGMKSFSIARDLLSEMARSKLMPAGSFQLERVKVDSITALLVAPICSHLADTLHTLEFHVDDLVESFTEEQEKALQLLTSLRELKFWGCSALQSLPQGLHHLSSLRLLEIFCCGKIQSLPPKEGVPTSLDNLQLWHCSPELNEKANTLKETDPDFWAILSVW